ncbi:hypothetical protein [Flavobacterium sp. TAB 87]|uniref:hypothetical protein n=1 Tax=Flavobacterium sp. TAB 87 TaxID=1729581 RepID=UPI00076CA4D6|nr:hypothetical protein [Flavobacterium sp. TAB 87]KVV13518.1 hypothetical protein AP058_02883 [Flavobacterium sp. TAB 87]
MRALKISVLAAIAFQAVGYAQETKSPFSLDGEFRPRTEWRDSGFSKTALEGAEGYFRTDARVRLGAGYKTESIHTYLLLQEVFVFGDRAQTATKGNDNFRVQEAWADIKLTSKSTFKVGRQTLSYDDQRILGALDWAQQSRTHDVGVFKLNENGYVFDAGFAVNSDGQDNLYNTAAGFSYKNMVFAHLNKQFGQFNMSLLVLGNEFQDATDPDALGPLLPSDNKSFLKTAGVHLDYTFDILKLSANGYVQDGYRLNDIAVDNAYLVSLDAAFKLSEVFGATLGAEIISGKDDSSVGFFPLYGTNHKFNGGMDRFYVGNYANANGLVDLHAGLSANLKNDFSVGLDVLYFTEQSQTKEYMGTELDFVIGKKFNGYALKGGYSQFFEPSRITNDKGNQNWAWLMLVVKPKFL